MARFNEVSDTHAQERTTNLAGAVAYKQDEKMEFVSILLTSFVQDQFYRSSDDALSRVRELLGHIDPIFAAKAAVYARNDFGMRSISHVIAGELARYGSGIEGFWRFYDRVIRRVDDITEILSYYKSINGSLKPLPSAMKKGLARALERQDAYALGKYRAVGKDISLVDAVNLVRPRATVALTQLVDGELRASTYQTGLTQAGQKAETEDEKSAAKAVVWEDFLDNPRVEYFALLRNLRNIEQQAPHLIDKVVAVLTDEQRIKRSGVFPFRFLSAMENVSDKRLVAACSDALDISVDNVPVFDGNTLVAIDISGSMTWAKLSAMGSRTPLDVAGIFGVALARSNMADIILFNTAAHYLSFNPRDSVMTTAKAITRAAGGGTDMSSVFRAASKSYDRIVVLTDMQSWVGDASWQRGVNVVEQSFRDFVRGSGTEPLLYWFDMTGYGTLKFPRDKMFEVAGFSEKVFDMMVMLEQDKTTIIDAIEAVEL